MKSKVVLEAVVLDLSPEYWGKMYPGSSGTRSSEPDASLKIWLRGWFPLKALKIHSDLNKALWGGPSRLLGQLDFGVSQDFSTNSRKLAKPQPPFF